MMISIVLELTARRGDSATRSEHRIELHATRLIDCHNLLLTLDDLTGRFHWTMVSIVALALTGAGRGFAPLATIAQLINGLRLARGPAGAFIAQLKRK